MPRVWKRNRTGETFVGYLKRAEKASSESAQKLRAWMRLEYVDTNAVDAAGWRRRMSGAPAAVVAAFEAAWAAWGGGEGVG